MYLHSTRGRFTPENTDFIFSSVRIQVDRTRVAVYHSLRAFPFCFAFVASTRAYSAVWFPLRVAFAFPAAPVVRFRLFFIPFDCARIALPCASLPIEPVCSPASRFICIPMAYVSAASPRALVRTVFHIPSPLPLSRDANPLVTCTCRVQLGCSGHPHTHISTYFPTCSRTTRDLTPSLTILRHY